MPHFFNPDDYFCINYIGRQASFLQFLAAFPRRFEIFFIYRSVRKLSFYY